MSEAMERRIRELAAELLAAKRVDLFLGYERGTRAMMSRPTFLVPEEGVSPVEQAQSLVWDSFCRNNLAVYLPPLYRVDPRRKPPPKPPGAAPATSDLAGRPGPRIGMVVKGCDLRSITTLLKEKQVPRQKLVLIGVPCRGMIDPRRVHRLFGEATVDALVEDGGEASEATVTITAGGREHRAMREDLLVRACAACRLPVPEKTDYQVEGPARAPALPASEETALDRSTSAERWELFRAEMAKCIRCNACRQACPNCYCKECFADQTDVRWIGAGTDLTDVSLYHLIRVFHQAGRCAGCDACAMACPMDVDLRLLTHRMVDDVRELFGFETSFDTEALAPIATFSESDSDSFITEP